MDTRRQRWVWWMVWLTPALSAPWLAAAASDVPMGSVVFSVRQPKGPHWYENIGYAITGPERTLYGSRGALGVLDVSTGETRCLIRDPDGAVRDPHVHYDGLTILFSYRRGGEEFFHLYEIGVDGSGLRQITDGPFDDIEPVYVPDDGIVFVSTRARRWVPCWYSQVATVYRCERDGTGMRKLSSNIEQDNTPWVLSDGRVLYTRWEYVDRSREHFHHLWSMNPDGTGQMVYYGNLAPGDVYLDAKPVPGTDAVLLINSPNHGRAEHQGAVALIHPKQGPDAAEAQTTVLAGDHYRDPYPVTADRFLVADETRLLVVDPDGGAEEIYRLPPELAADGAWLHEPRVLRPRRREPVIPSRVDPGASHGRLLVADVYQGRRMEGVPRGAIKKLLVLENLPKPVNFTGSMDPISFGGSYTLNRVLGEAPVAEDGSVHIRVPALRSLQLVALDENDLAVKRMMSFLTVMPGEQVSCVGCHEPRTQAGPHAGAPSYVTRLAWAQPPQDIEPIPGAPAVFDFPRDIQPILDRLCVECHDADTYAGRALLTGDHGPMFTHGYFTLVSRLQVADGRDLARGNYPPYGVGSAASPLLDKLTEAHHGVRATPDDLRMVKLWIDASATFPGTYAALGSGMIGPYAALQYKTKQEPDYQAWPEVRAASEVQGRRCNTCHEGDRQLPLHPGDTLGLRHHHLAYGDGPPRFWTPPWIRPYDDTLPVGSLAWMREHADPRLRFSRHALFNLADPARSVLVLAPLAETAGGLGICGDVFAGRDDPDHRVLVDMIARFQTRLDMIGRFNRPGFRPEPEYIREMQRFGVLPPQLEPGATLDVYDLDRRYWESMAPVSKSIRTGSPRGEHPPR